MGLQLCFERASGGIIPSLIDEFSGRGGYCHAAIRFSDGNYFASDNGVGTQWHDASYDAGSFDYAAVPVDAEQEAAIRAWCSANTGRPYSWVKDIDFLCPIPPHGNGLFCSECAVLALQSIGLLGIVPAAKVSPNALWLIAKAMGWN
jgi:hypothetical protein